MSFFSALGTFFIGPLKLIFEVIYKTAYDIVSDPGLAIIFLSLAMNVLVLPLYKRADDMQKQARDTEAKLKAGIDHIKKTFSGNERMMMLQTYYRQNDYSPTNALRGSVSLLLEIPFFMAAYQFLSHLDILKGVSFGPIADLSAPDGLIVIGTLSINLLPVLMTLINFISSAIYLRGFPLKTKLQLYGMALFFLVFLYDSPSGLVFYWTLNNVFSLLKNIFYKLKNPKKVLSILTFVLGAAVLTLHFGADAFGLSGLKRRIVLIVGAALLLPLVLYFVKRKLPRRETGKTVEPDKKIFILAALFLSVFVGALIPSIYIADSPQEYVDVTYFFNPVWYVVNSFLLAAGTFVLWFGVFYWLAGKKGKVIFERAMWCLFGVAVVDYMFFGTGLGIVSSALKYENGLTLSRTEKFINLGVIVLVVAALTFVIVKWRKAAGAVLVTAVLATTVLTGINVVKSIQSVNSVKIIDTEESPHFSLSKEGKNVVILFLDRALGEDLPYLLNENPGLKDIYDGFTYYSNVISYGGHTNFGAPPLMGGYEYTPVEMNKRDTELLVEKHNESLKVMPVAFLNKGFDVTVCDAPYANYEWIPDLSIYDDYPEINTYITKGMYGSVEAKQLAIDADMRNFFCFSLMKSSPLFVQYALYNGGNYNALTSSPETSTNQEGEGISTSSGINSAFMESYNVLCSLNGMTLIEDGDADNFLLFYNDAPHEPMMFDEAAGYTVSSNIDNTEFDEKNKDRFTVDGKSLNIRNRKQMMHYQSNMAVLMRVGEWLDYLRENDVYDNTKIIIVADHGYYLYQSNELYWPDHMMPSGVSVDIGNYFPLLMVKDFGSEGFKTSDEFMTNADVPTIAFDGCISDPVNPFTGKAINSDEKTAHDQFIITDHLGWNTGSNNGYTFEATTWAAVTNNIWDRDDWKFIDDSVILYDHKMP